MRIIGYARVSSREQAENSHALEQQIERLKAAGATEILSDVESGTNNDRIAFNQVIDLVKSRAVDGVIVTRLDRLTRSLPTLRVVVNQFQHTSVNLCALDDNINLSTAAGKFHLNILGSLAEMEVDRLSERVRHGWSHLRDRKVAMNPPFGYTKVDDRHKLDHSPFLSLLMCPVEPLLDRNTQRPIDHPVEYSKAMIADCLINSFLQYRTLRRALRWMNETYGIQTFAHNNANGKPRGGRLAQQMFRFSPSGFKEWLINPVLQGHTCYLRKRNGQRLKPENWDIRHNTHPEQALVTTVEAQQIEAILSHNRQVRGYGSTALKYPLSGLVFCGECRSACYSTCGRKNYKHPERGFNYYFQCKNWRVRSCTQKTTVRMEVAEQAVIEALTQRSETISQIAQLPPEQQEPLELKELRQQLKQLESIPGHNPVIEGAKRELRQQIDAYQYQLKQDDTAKSANRDLLLQVFGDRSYWKTLLDSEKREIYRALVDRVIMRDGQVEQVQLKV
ncbi:fdxN element excision recombinase XisF [Egbenema bharatensis]|uniref:fdxN element excision recombinase XisF n=1 Tax=Egbenema bharatensis TaxID=3463334 RepID=UPI003A849308